MRHLKGILTLSLLITINNYISAQDIETPWVIGVGINSVHNPTSGDNDATTGLNPLKGRYSTWNMEASALRVTVARYLDGGFIFEMVGSRNTIGENFPITGAEFDYLSLDGMVKLNLSKAKNPVNTINPYVGIGGGYTWLDKIGAGTLNGTFGINYWFGRNFGLNLQATIKQAFKDYGLKHFQHSGGVVYRFTGDKRIKDKDGDGVPDRKDECPDQAGLAKYNGCPDNDGDGLEDRKDDCPNQAGLAIFNGCPDSDGDGIQDKDDACPEVPGILANKGCPIPDSDQDGVLDSEDRCPTVAGSIDNFGCPLDEQISKQDEEKINYFARTLLFQYGKTTLRSSDKAALDEVVAIMNTYPFSKFSIEGHTDNSSGPAFNLRLSLNRAKAVKDYLVSQGIDPDRLSAQGFGEGRPIASNSTKEGRRMNRRVEIVLRN
ncbi:MAG: OmpA family protein [Bacteroidia bacterium]|nr:OmpA family protein [Bacteroidia bacterium]MBT8311150.1 OmpA family protein [Bacteroidia bacterium]NND09972.1 OmpA family protein [Flavobacteriaceae bacterium]NNK27900.1 OmpA family protein [Flavobacteriaceae bacterium]NNL61714.1 OmpA family protein [Flavobacteriaceae bacterium]